MILLVINHFMGGFLYPSPSPSLPWRLLRKQRFCFLSVYENTFLKPLFGVFTNPQSIFLESLKQPCPYPSSSQMKWPYRSLVPSFHVLQDWALPSACRWCVYHVYRQLRWLAWLMESYISTSISSQDYPGIIGTLISTLSCAKVQYCVVAIHGLYNNLHTPQPTVPKQPPDKHFNPNYIHVSTFWSTAPVEKLFKPTMLKMVCCEHYCATHLCTPLLSSC